jgi:hypothetical protein
VKARIPKAHKDVIEESLVLALEKQDQVIAAQRSWIKGLTGAAHTDWQKVIDDLVEKQEALQGALDYIRSNQ